MGYEVSGVQCGDLQNPTTHECSERSMVGPSWTAFSVDRRGSVRDNADSHDKKRSRDCSEVQNWVMAC